jgi:hypothetical protein
LTVFYRDSSIVNTLQVNLRAYDSTGTNFTVATALSTGLNGYGTASSDPFSYIVNSEVGALVVRAAVPDDLGTLVQI